MDNREWELIVPVGDMTWKDIAMEVLSTYTKRTDGSWIEDKEFGMVWHYENVDPEYGKMQAEEVSKLLKRLLKNDNNMSIDVVLYDYNRILDIKPSGISKGNAASRILQQILSLPLILPSTSPSTPQSTTSTPTTGRKFSYESRERKEIPFLMCVGDDRSDEAMFIAVEMTSEFLRTGQFPETKQRITETDYFSHLTQSQLQQSTFTICVGIKHSAARYYVHDHTEVRNLVQTLAETHTGNNGPLSTTKSSSTTTTTKPTTPTRRSLLLDEHVSPAISKEGELYQEPFQPKNQKSIQQQTLQHRKKGKNENQNIEN